jgi:hypothetical protein
MLLTRSCASLISCALVVTACHSASSIRVPSLRVVFRKRIEGTIAITQSRDQLYIIRRKHNGGTELRSYLPRKNLIRRIKTHGLGPAPEAFVFGSGSLWVGNTPGDDPRKPARLANTLVQIDAQSGSVKSVRRLAWPTKAAYSPHLLWVVTVKNTLWRVSFPSRMASSPLRLPSRAVVNLCGASKGLIVSTTSEVGNSDVELIGGGSTLVKRGTRIASRIYGLGHVGRSLWIVEERRVVELRLPSLSITAETPPFRVSTIAPVSNSLALAGTANGSVWRLNVNGRRIVTTRIGRPLGSIDQMFKVGAAFVAYDSTRAQLVVFHVS